MSLVIVQAIRSQYATPLGVRHLEFLEAVARATSLGLVQKTSGTFIPHPTAGGVSQDVLMDKAGWAVDILRDAEGVAEAQWNAIAPIDPSRYVPVSNGAPPIPPEPPTPPIPPTPPVDLSKILERLETLQQSVDGAQTMLKETQSMVMNIEEDVERVKTVSGALIAAVNALAQRPFPVYTGGLGMKLRLTPEK